MIIDNTGVVRWESVPYFKLAMFKSYSVVLVEPRTPWRYDVDQLVQKNSHGVSRQVNTQS